MFFVKTVLSFNMIFREVNTLYLAPSIVKYIHKKICSFLPVRTWICTAEGISNRDKVSSFADDTRLLRGVKTEEDCQSLQNDLANLYRWAEEVGMSYSAFGLTMMKRHCLTIYRIRVK